MILNSVRKNFMQRMLLGFILVTLFSERTRDAQKLCLSVVKWTGEVKAFVSIIAFDELLVITHGVCIVGVVADATYLWLACFLGREVDK